MVTSAVDWNGQAFQEGIARQLKSSQQQPVQIAELICLSDWIEEPQSSFGQMSPLQKI
jgi:hypothetical protein